MDIPEGRLRADRLDIEFTQVPLSHTIRNVLNYIIRLRCLKRSNFG